MTPTAAEQRAIALIEQLVPADAEKRVRQAMLRISPVVREIIRSETGLRLTDGEVRGALPVQVVAGVPTRLADVVARRPDPILWRFVALRPKLTAAATTLGELTELLPALADWPHLPQGMLPDLDAIPVARDIVGALAALKSADEIRADIKKIEEDILGRYFYPEFVPPHIELYWMPIALLSQTLDVSIEDLTAVVLAHELAHGYTHIGLDIDRKLWDREAFARTDVHVKEGLAQHYTSIVTQKLGVRLPEAHKAYLALLDLQSGPYLAHQDWLKAEPERRGEAVRFALVAARVDSITHVDWKSLLERTSRHLRNGGKPVATIRAHLGTAPRDPELTLDDGSEN